MNCAGQRCRWANVQRYEKPSTGSKEAEERMAKIMADRAAQDAQFFPSGSQQQCAGGVCSLPKPGVGGVCNNGGICKK